MDLRDYFESAKGVGILATSDASGAVDVAIYARPYIIDDNTIAFSMLERLSYANISSNPHAAYMFLEDTEGYAGKRLYLTKVREETDSDRIKELKKKHSKIFKPDEINRHLVYFTIDKIRPLVGDET
jgi:hypothetical protein